MYITYWSRVLKDYTASMISSCYTWYWLLLPITSTRTSVLGQPKYMTRKTKWSSKWLDNRFTNNRMCPTMWAYPEGNSTLSNKSLHVLFINFPLAIVLCHYSYYLVFPYLDWSFSTRFILFHSFISVESAAVWLAETWRGWTMQTSYITLQLICIFLRLKWCFLVGCSMFLVWDVHMTLSNVLYN